MEQFGIHSDPRASTGIARAHTSQQNVLRIVGSSLAVRCPSAAIPFVVHEPSKAVRRSPCASPLGEPPRAEYPSTNTVRSSVICTRSRDDRPSNTQRIADDCTGHLTAIPGGSRLKHTPVDARGSLWISNCSVRAENWPSQKLLCEGHARWVDEQHSDRFGASV